MAHGYLQHMIGKQSNIYSAGIETHGVNPGAIAIMQKDGIDISQHTSNHIDEYSNIAFDYVITVCDHAKESCPVFPSHGHLFHHNFSDPSKISGDPETIEVAFQNTRNQIKTWLTAFVQAYHS